MTANSLRERQISPQLVAQYANEALSPKLLLQVQEALCLLPGRLLVPKSYN